MRYYALPVAAEVWVATSKIARGQLYTNILHITDLCVPLIPLLQNPSPPYVPCCTA